MAVIRENKSFFYEFGNYRLSPAERQLSRGKTPIALTPKAFETLLALVEKENRLVTKDELIEIVWGDVIVEEIGLTRNISVLRKVLDDNDHRNPKFIETVFAVRLPLYRAGAESFGSIRRNFAANGFVGNFAFSNRRFSRIRQISRTRFCRFFDNPFEQYQKNYRATDGKRFAIFGRAREKSFTNRCRTRCSIRA